MYEVILAVLSILNTPNPDGVCLADAQRFQVDPQSCRALWKLTTVHPATMRPEVEAWNSPNALYEWEQETHWRERCWNFLDDALFCDIRLTHKLSSLARLRELLGDEAYFAGWMPAPLPSYRR